MSIKTLLPFAPIGVLLVVWVVCEISNYRFTKNVIEPADRESLGKRAEYIKNKMAYEERFECKYPRESMGRIMCSRGCEHFDRIWSFRCDMRGGNR